MTFSDIHAHILHATDDGPKTREDMFKMLDAAYADGTRLLFATPHFHPGFFDDNREQIRYSFAVLKEYCESKYKDMRLFLGNELFYTHDSVSWMKNKLCLPMGDTRYVLVEFDVTATEDNIAEAMDRLLNIGYVPILAHVERYGKLGFGRITALRENGVLLQMNAEALKPHLFGFKLAKRVKALLSDGMVDFISTDMHDMVKRPPIMSNAYNYLSEKYGHTLAEQLCRTNAERLLCGERTAEVNV